MKKSEDGVLTPEMIEEAYRNTTAKSGLIPRLILSVREYRLYQHIREIEPDYVPRSNIDIYFKVKELKMTY